MKVERSKSKPQYRSPSSLPTDEKKRFDVEVNKLNYTDPDYEQKRMAIKDKYLLINGTTDRVAVNQTGSKKSIETELRGLGVYTEVRHLRGQLYENAEFQALRGTYLIRVSKDSKNEKILVGASGIACKTGSTNANRYYLLETTLKPSFLNEFYTKVIESNTNLGDSFYGGEKEPFAKFFEKQEKINPKELENMMQNITKDMDLLKPSGFVPMYYAPKNGDIALLEHSILSDTVKSAIYAFKEEQNILSQPMNDFFKSQVVFFKGYDNKTIVPTNKTRDAIEDIKNPKPKEQPKKPWYNPF